MNNILVITGMYLPSPSANGACLDSVLKKMHEKGYYAYIVSFSNNTSDFSCPYAKVFPINTYQHRGSNFFVKLKNGYNQLIHYPLFPKRIINEAIRKCKEIIDNERIELIVCVQKPASCGIVCSKLKELYPNLPTILYELDSLTDNIDNYETWTKFFKKRNWETERFIYKNVDNIFHLESHRAYYSHNSYSEYLNKSIYVDIPLIERDVYQKSEITAPREEKKIVYSGVLSKKMRNPKCFLDTFEYLIRKGARFNISVFSRGDCDCILDTYSKGCLNGCLTSHGYIQKSDLDVIIGRADILISIGNSFKIKVAAIPSKVFYYISTGKPIVHFACDKDDMCIPYLEKYTRSLILFQNEDLYSNALKLNNFIESLDGTLESFELIENTFEKNTAQFTTDAIINVLSKQI